MLVLGKIRPGSTIYFPFDSFAGSTGASASITGLAVGDIKVFKDGSTTERASTSGFTLLDTDGIDFDGITGHNDFSIDLSDNTTADFWQSGSRYKVVISSITVDSQTVNFTVAIFQIGETTSFLDTFIATLASQTSFTLNSGPAEDDALNGREVWIHDAGSAVQRAWGIVLDYTGSTRTVTLAAAPTFTIAAKDNVSVMGMAPLQPVTSGRTALVAADGSISPNWADVKSPTTTLALTGTTIATTQKVDIETIKTQALTAAAGITFGVYVGGTAAAALEATSQTIVADTAELQTDWANGGRLDLILDARASQTSVDDVPTVAEFEARTILAASYGTAANQSTIIGYIDTEVAAIYSRIGLPVGASISEDIASVKNDTGNLVTRITSTLFSGITSLAQWLGLMTGKQVGNTTARTELRATGAGSGTFDETTESLEAIKDSASAPTVQEIDAQLTASHGAGNWAHATGGTGARTVTITVNDGAAALENANVRLSQGAESYVLATNVSGVAVFALDDATWSVTITKPGYTFTPTTILVNGNTTATYSLTSVSILPSDPDKVTGYLYCDNAGVRTAGVKVSIQQITKSSANGLAQDGDIRTESSDTNGLVQFTNLFVGAEYRVWRENSSISWRVTITNDDPFELISVIG